MKCFCLLALCTLGCVHQRPVNPFGELGPLSKLRQEKQKERYAEENLKINSVIQARKSKPKVAKVFPLPHVMSEESLYTEVLRSYQIRDLDQLDFFADQFVERYSQSVFADNALYLKAQLRLAMGLVSESLREFDKVITQYPMGNKYSAALFGKAVAFRKLRLFKYAEDTLRLVRNGFPGSAEYYKVELEEKLLGLERDSL